MGSVFEFSAERSASGDMKGDDAERLRAPAGPERRKELILMKFWITRQEDKEVKF